MLCLFSIFIDGSICLRTTIKLIKHSVFNKISFILLLSEITFLGEYSPSNSVIAVEKSLNLGSEIFGFIFSIASNFVFFLLESFRTANDNFVKAQSILSF